MSIENQNEASTFVLLDEQGRGPWSMSPPYYQAVPIPDGDVTRDDAFCSPCDQSQENANNINLIYSVTYMAQSAAGRTAIKTISDNHIKIGYDETFQREGKPQAGYRDGIPFILLLPSLEPAIQHIGLIQQAAQFETVLQLVKQNVPVARMANALSVCGVVAMIDHGEECLDNRRQNPNRFVPPKLQAYMDALLASPLITELKIPQGKDVRTAYKQRVLAETINPNAELRTVLGKVPADTREAEPS